MIGGALNPLDGFVDAFTESEEKLAGNIAQGIVS
jgi:hypothetical protein